MSETREKRLSQEWLGQILRNRPVHPLKAHTNSWHFEQHSYRSSHVLALSRHQFERRVKRL